MTPQTRAWRRRVGRALGVVDALVAWSRTADARVNGATVEAAAERFRLALRRATGAAGLRQRPGRIAARWERTVRSVDRGLGALPPTGARLDAQVALSDLVAALAPVRAMAFVPVGLAAPPRLRGMA